MTSPLRLRLRRRAGAVALALACAPALCLLPAAAATPAPGASLQIEALTWPELAQRIAAGATTVLLPIGGTEQNGPHMVLGKHNVRVQALAGLIAQGLGQTLVAPVLAYVPEGAIEPPAAHMRYPGTISIPEPAFEALLESAARSFRRHGFRQVVLLGDHGGYQASLARVAARLNREWAADPAVSRCRVLALAEYYRAAQDGHARLLAARGYSAAEIGSHAGLADTALALAIDPALVRSALLQPGVKVSGREGVLGEPGRASAELGRLGVDHIVAASVAAIRGRSRPP
jgi:creatinine amidohydrolase/Fe(II)-dependent formamide hydrolase-like protein